MLSKPVRIIGAGLAGCEAAYQLAQRGIKVILCDAKPGTMTDAHKNPLFAELVCSNSLKSNNLDTASGLLKQELRLMGSLCIEAADKCAVPAGGALAVDRELFSQYITAVIRANPNIEIINETAGDWDTQSPTIIATGPLTLNPLYQTLEKRLGAVLHFYDAAAPIVDAESIDYSCTFEASRYGKGDSDYVNCPLNREEYEAFIAGLVSAKTALLSDFEKGGVFEGCMPVEVMASRGADSLRFGPLKPVGLYDKDGKRPYAVVQLRRENAQGSMYNLVGFQTNLTFSEQKRVFGMIPALKNAEFLRYGVMHRNSFVEAPKCLNADFSTQKYPLTFIAGQLSGVEGYCESIMSGLVAALGLLASLNGKKFIPPRQTLSGALCDYLTRTNASFQPMNANFGLLLPFMQNTGGKKDKKQQRTDMSARALAILQEYLRDCFG